MIVLVCGGREFGDPEAVKAALGRLKLEPLHDLLVHGGASGADQLAHWWTMQNEIPCLRIPAPWRTKGKSAGILRNLRMLDFMGLKPDLVVAFPGGNGTAHMIKSAAAAGIPLWLPQQHAELPSQLSDQLRSLLDTTSQGRSSRLPSAESNEEN
jgi:hypothetical protein